MDSDEEPIEELCEEVSQIRPKITFETFDPFNKASLIDSPRSLKVCSKHGILLQELYHKSFDELKRKFAGPTNMGKVKELYAKTEKRRKELVQKLIMARRRILEREKDNTSSHQPYDRSLSFASAHSLHSLNYSPINMYLKEQKYLKAYHKKKLMDLSEISRAYTPNLRSAKGQIMDKSKPLYNWGGAFKRFEHHSLIEEGLIRAQERRKTLAEIKRSHLERLRLVEDEKQAEYKKYREQREESKRKEAEIEWEKWKNSMSQAESRKRQMIERLKSLVRARNNQKFERMIERKERMEFESERKRSKTEEYLKRVEERSLNLWNARLEAEKERKNIMKVSVINKHNMANFFEKVVSMRGAVTPDKYHRMPEFYMDPSPLAYKSTRSKSPALNIPYLRPHPYHDNARSIASFRTPHSKLSKLGSFSGSQSKGSLYNAYSKYSPMKVPQSGSSIFERVYGFAEQHTRQIKQLSRKVDEIQGIYK